MNTPGDTVNLRSIDDIPSEFQHVFAHYKTFNKVQSKVFNDILYSDNSFVLSAPTGSGKTVIFELAIVQLLMNLKTNQKQDDIKIIYIAPIKALCSERYTDWMEKFSPLNINCCEVTGDTTEIKDFKDLIDYQLILTTPEKWDSLTRKWQDNKNIVKLINLLFLDEVHLINEDKRGPILEAVVARMKTIDTNKRMRIIAVSATIPNIKSFAQWLGNESDDSNVKMFTISEDMRPVKITKHVLGYKDNPGQSSFHFDLSLNYKLADIIKKYSQGEPSLIFCSTRKGVELASNVLIQKLPLQINKTLESILCSLSSRVNDVKLKKSLPNGIAFHHGGLTTSDRKLIEDNFRLSYIPVLLCTSTLAMGINLPAHLVIIKSTQYGFKGDEEYPESSILQMIGRAGRPQFHESGTAVIMTQTQNVQKYIRLVSGTTPVESHLHKHLTEHLNSEIVLQTIYDLSVTVNWLKSTFLYVRAHDNPVHYGLARESTRAEIDKKLEGMCLVAINSLEQYNLVAKDQSRQTELKISATAFGQLMSRYYISFETMKLFSRTNGTETLPQVFNILTQCQEFMDFTLRASDKKLLNELNCSKELTIRYPIKGKIKTLNAKVSCLIQSMLGNLSIKNASLYQEASNMMILARRLAKCLYEYIVVAEKLNKQGMFNALLNTIILAKCFEARLWDNSPYVSRQLKKIGPMYSSILAKDGKTTFESILKCQPCYIEKVLNKNPPFGNEIIEQVSKFPEYYIELKITTEQKLKLKITQINNGYVYNAARDEAVLIVGDLDTNCLLFHSENVCSIIERRGCFQKDICITMKNQRISTSLINKKIVGIDVQNLKTLRTENDGESSNIVDRANTLIKRNKTPSKLTDYFNVSKKSSCDESLNDVTMNKSVAASKRKSNKLKQLTLEISTDTGNDKLSRSKRNLKSFEYNPANKIVKLNEDASASPEDESNEMKTATAADELYNTADEIISCEIQTSRGRNMPSNCSKVLSEGHVNSQHNAPVYESEINSNDDEFVFDISADDYKQFQQALPFPLFYRESAVEKTTITYDSNILWHNNVTGQQNDTLTKSTSSMESELRKTSSSCLPNNETFAIINPYATPATPTYREEFNNNKDSAGSNKIQYNSDFPRNYNQIDDDVIVSRDRGVSPEIFSSNESLDSSFMLPLTQKNKIVRNEQCFESRASLEPRNQDVIADRNYFNSPIISMPIDVNDTFYISPTQNMTCFSPKWGSGHDSNESRTMNITAESIPSLMGHDGFKLNDTFELFNIRRNAKINSNPRDDYTSITDNTYSNETQNYSIEYFKPVKSNVLELDDSFDISETQFERALNRVDDDLGLPSTQLTGMQGLSLSTRRPATPRPTPNYNNWDDSFEMPQTPVSIPRNSNLKKDFDIGIKDFLKMECDDNPFSDIFPSQQAIASISQHKPKGSWCDDSFSDALLKGNYSIDFDNVSGNRNYQHFTKKAFESIGKPLPIPPRPNASSHNLPAFHKKNSNSTLSSIGKKPAGKFPNTKAFFENASKTFSNRHNPASRIDECSKVNYDEFIRSKFMN